MQGIGCTRVVFGQSDTPNTVYWTGFCQNAFAGSHQKVMQIGGLCKLGLIAAADDVETVCVPNFIPKTANLPSQGFGLRRTARQQNLPVDFRRTKEPRFFRHHVMFGGGIAYTFKHKRRRKPLAEGGGINHPRFAVVYAPKNRCISAWFYADKRLAGRVNRKLGS